MPRCRDTCRGLRGFGVHAGSEQASVPKGAAADKPRSIECIAAHRGSTTGTFRSAQEPLEGAGLSLADACGVSSVHTSLTMLSLRLTASTEACVALSSASYQELASATALSSAPTRSARAPRCASCALDSPTSRAWASLADASSSACLPRPALSALSRFPMRSWMDAWRVSRSAFSSAIRSRSEPCCLSRAALSLSRRPARDSILRRASASSRV
mmetsp:Transcript_62441/g.186025  ORF Transcript_62441/g.186025 Transcript_62441/m.186025 type:complete len:214 (+) Transcript_62441:223-864(+)